MFLIITVAVTSTQLMACDPPISESIRYTEFAYVKVIEENPQEILYKKTQYIDNKFSDIYIEYKLIKVEILDILNKKTFLDYSIQDKINIAIPMVVYDKIKDYDEFIIDEGVMNLNNFYDTNLNGVQPECDMIYYDNDDRIENFIPVKDNKIYLDGFEYEKDYSYVSIINMLIEGNFSEEIVFQHGMTIEELNEYFILRYKKFGNEYQCGVFDLAKKAANYFVIYILVFAVGISIYIVFKNRRRSNDI